MDEVVVGVDGADTIGDCISGGEERLRRWAQNCFVITIIISASRQTHVLDSGKVLLGQWDEFTTRSINDQGFVVGQGN